MLACKGDMPFAAQLVANAVSRWAKNRPLVDIAASGNSSVRYGDRDGGGDGDEYPATRQDGMSELLSHEGNEPLAASSGGLYGEDVAF